ncbi:hypothetical protein BsWGS_26880 [Bradybaena similaris]
MTRQCCILGALALIVSLCFQRGNPFSIRTEPPLGPDETCDTPDCIVAGQMFICVSLFVSLDVDLCVAVCVVGC